MINLNVSVAHNAFFLSNNIIEIYRRSEIKMYTIKIFSTEYTCKFAMLHKNRNPAQEITYMFMYFSGQTVKLMINL